MRTITHHADFADLASLFTVEVSSARRGKYAIRCYAHDGRGYDNVPFINQASACLKDHYTAEDRAASARLASEEPVRDGEIVLLNGRQYRVKVIGDYSDAARLLPVD